LRQAVLVTAELEPVAEALREALGFGEPFRDPGVGEFGLHNAVFALGDCFIEVISPTQPGTAAGRYLERHGGDGGYMAIFDLEDLEGARRRAAEAGVRVVWQIDLPDISGTHLHPADMRGAIVSLDRSRPYGSWRWGGPQWMGQISDASGSGRLVGMTVAVVDPAAVAARWGLVLGARVESGPRPSLRLDGSTVELVEAVDDRGEGIVQLAFADLPALALAGDVTVGGVRLACVDGAAL
jgi:Glyoxalase-like domain